MSAVNAERLHRAVESLRDASKMVEGKPEPTADHMRQIANMGIGAVFVDPSLAVLLADWLELMATDYAPYWSEPYAAPFVPVIEKAYLVADAILGTAA